MKTDLDEELRLHYAAEYEDFLRRERLWEIRKREATSDALKRLVRAFVVTLITGGIFWVVVIWRYLR